MKKDLRKISGSIKKFTDSKELGVSFAALWYGILMSLFLWILLVGMGTMGLVIFTDETIYVMEGLLKLVTWSVFFLGGFLAAYRAGFKGWQHGLWTGVFLGFLSAIFLLEVVPTLVGWEHVLFQWAASVMLGTSGGIVGLKALQAKKARLGYSFKEAKKQKFFGT
ncbi:MAG: hypothetical protein GXY91_11140 [Clostridia bacterium]|nr:hypothetical protein [Clostridia bacterium]